MLRQVGTKVLRELRRDFMVTRSIASSRCRQKSLSAERLESLQTNGSAFGQPTPITHPHLLKPGELTAGIAIDEYVLRRQRLVELLRKHCVDNQIETAKQIVVIPASGKKFMSDHIPYVFRQNSDFFYLTGCLEQDSVLVLTIEDELTSRWCLFMRPKDDREELWDGPRTGINNSLDFFAVDEAQPVTELENFIEKFVKKNPSHLFWYDEKAAIQVTLTEKIRRIRNASDAFQNPTKFLHEQRVIKSPAEIELMRKTCLIASEAINGTMQQSKVGDSEHEIFARVDVNCRMAGASFLAYPPVVASGKNATTIHYINNSQRTGDSDLVLMDAGCEYGGYSSDITRTWPISGEFTSAQMVLYDVVSAVQSEILDAVEKVEKVSLDQLFDLMCHRLGNYLQEIGLIDKSLTGIAIARAGFEFCPHHVSHYLGMDIHDTPTISRQRLLEPGMIFTVEPGIYISTNNSSVPKEFRGIGIRIEDDVLRTENNSIENLTQKCVKNRDELIDLLAKE